MGSEMCIRDSPSHYLPSSAIVAIVCNSFYCLGHFKNVHDDDDDDDDVIQTACRDSARRGDVSLRARRPARLFTAARRPRGVSRHVPAHLVSVLVGPEIQNGVT